MNDTQLRSGVFVLVALLTIVLAYLYQRNQRVQALNRVWVWPLVFGTFAVVAVFRRLPLDSQFVMWLTLAFALGLILGAARGFAFEVRSGEKPGTLILRPTFLSGAIFMIALLFNEFEHVFQWGDRSLPHIACSLVVLTAGSSIGANVARVIRWKYMRA